jgi:acyl-CoA thioesterase
MSGKTGFSALLSQTCVSDDTLIFKVSEDWTQGRTAFGGLQAAMAITAMRRLVPAQIPLRVLQVTFIGPVAPGDVAVQARVLRTGKSVTHAEARLVSGSDIGCVVVGVFGSVRESSLAIDNCVYPELPAAEGLPDMLLFPGITPNFLQHCAPPFTGAREAHSAASLSGSTNR